jgi:hypothetical protein
MKTLRQFINETFANRMGTDSKLPSETSIDDPGIKNQFKKAKKYDSNSSDHVIYHVKDKDGYNHHIWVHRKTGHVDFYMKTNDKPGKLPDEKFHSNILIQGRANGPSMGITAFHDLWSGKLGHYGIAVHDNQSKGAIRLHNRLRQHFGKRALYHTYNPETGEAKHLTHGVAASGKTPDELFDAIHKVQIVGMMAPKHRPPLPK